MWPHCWLFVHLGPCACIHIGCLLVEGATWHIPGNTFQSAAAAAWRGKAVKSARPPLFTPLQFTVRWSPHPPHPSFLSSCRSPRLCRQTLAASLGSLDTRRGVAACRGSHATTLPSSTGSERQLTTAGKHGRADWNESDTNELPQEREEVSGWTRPLKSFHSDTNSKHLDGRRPQLSAARCHWSHIIGHIHLTP